MPGDRFRVAVIGGGVSGLVAARELALGGASVELYEASDRLGGRIAQVELGGASFDIGAEAFATRGGAVADLLADLGLADRVVFPSPLGSWVISSGRALKLPASGTLGIPAAPLAADSRRALGLAAALRAAIEPLLPRRVGAQATTVGALVRARMGRRVLDRLVRPVTLGVHSTAPEDLPLVAVSGLVEAYAAKGSLLRAARILRGRTVAAGGAVAALAGGMGMLISALRAELAALEVGVHRGAAVRGVERCRDGWRLRFDCTGLGDAAADTSVQFDALLLAVPEAAARAVLGLPSREGSAHPVEVVALLIQDARLDAAPRGTGALVASTRLEAGPVAGSEAIIAKALTHVTAKWPDRARALPIEHHVLRLSYGRAGRAPETAGIDDDAALARAVYDASRILEIRLRPEDIRAFARRTWEMPLPSGDPSPIAQPGVALVGDWVAGAGLASVIPRARATAEGLLAEARARDAGRLPPRNRSPRTSNRPQESLA